MEVSKQYIAGSTLAIMVGDITEQHTDAIVNAANSSLCGGGGVDGAIHRAGGPIILEQCRTYVREHGRLPPGKAMATDAGELPARWVIHTVGPVYSSDRESKPILESAYRESLLLAEQMGIESLSFPSISTGAYRYPLEKAAQVALSTISSQLRKGSPLRLVRMVCFTERDGLAYKRAMDKIVQSP
ncbi:MAG: O-acetyl-ADP-ribose deacetylase [Candidatus Bipolaricaulota bacterium]|nr:O-acetyl-ADP-ribose deacetylase [Candidatus Bipolaricaulota bacterium]